MHTHRNSTISAAAPDGCNHLSPRRLREASSRAFILALLFVIVELRTESAGSAVATGSRAKAGEYRTFQYANFSNNVGTSNLTDGWDVPERVATDVTHSAISDFSANFHLDANADSDENADFNLTANSDGNRVLLSNANISSSVDDHDSSNNSSGFNDHDANTNARPAVRSLASNGGTKKDARTSKAVAGRGLMKSKSGTVLTVGCLFAPDMPGGVDMLAASVMAVEEINGDPRILPNHVLHLTVQNYSIASFGSQLAAFGLLENHPVAVIGPHTSDQAARFSPIAAATQVPFISASATDVQLTQGATRPFFMRTVASDGVQMAAMAELIKHYKWQQVALIYSDDRFGRNGVAALTSQLITIRAEADVAVRVAIPRSATDEAIHDYISSLVPLDVAVYVLHASATVFSTVVEAARKLRLYARSSVWIASDAAAAMSFTFNQHLDGLIITTTHLPSSPHLSSFLDRWKHLNASQYPGLSKETPSPYALSSHDAVTLVARALHSLLYPSPPASTNSSSHALKQTQQRNISPHQQSISPQQERQQQKRVQQQAGQQQEGEGGAFQQLELPVLPSLPNGTQDALAPPLTRLQQSAMGPALRKALLKTSFDGLQGRIALTPHGDLAESEIRILNIQKRAPMEVALWSSSLGLVPSSSRPPPQSAPPSTASPAPRPGPVAVPSTQTPNALPIIFPGGLTQVPTGSFPKTRLRIAVPNKQQYKEYVNVSDALGEGNSRFSGYCVEVFRLAVTRLPYKLDYEFVLYGDKDLSYTQMVLAVANKTYDAAVGDITVLDSRSKFVFFTHPIQQSGLGVMGYSRPYSNPWMVFSPFTASMWAVTAAICLTTGLLAMMLDRQRTPDFQGPLQTRFMTAVWYGCHTFFSIPVFRIRTTLARVVVCIWLLLAFIIANSYVASLTSILTVQKFLPQILDIYSALTSNSPIGYQQGSFVHTYLLQLGVAPDKLVSLAGESEYASSLASGRVTVIVDEDPYLNLFSAAFCDGVQAPQPFSILNLAFAFPKGSQVGADISQAILQLAMKGELERLKEQYLQKDNMCVDDETASAVLTEVNVHKFTALLILYLVVSLLCCAAYVGLLIYRGYRYHHREAHGSHRSPRHEEEEEGEEEDEEAADQQLLWQQQCFGLSCGPGGNTGASYKTGKGGKNRPDIHDNGGFEGGRDTYGRASVGNEEGGGSIEGYVDAGPGPSSNPFSHVPASSTTSDGSSSSSSTITTTTTAAPAAAAAATAETITRSAGCLPLFEPLPTASHRASSSRTGPSPAPGSGTCSPSGRAVSGVTASCLGGPVWPDPSIALGSAACVGMSGKGSKRPEVLEPLLEEGSEEGGIWEEVQEEERDGDLGISGNKDAAQRGAAAIVEKDVVVGSDSGAAASDAASAAAAQVTAAAGAAPAAEMVSEGAVAAGVVTGGVEAVEGRTVAAGQVVAGGAVAAVEAPSGLPVSTSISHVGEAAAEREASGEGEAKTEADAETAGSAITTTTAAAAACAAAAAASAAAAAAAANTAPAAAAAAKLSAESSFPANVPTTDHGTSRLIPGLPPVNLGSTSILSSVGATFDAAASLRPKITTTTANSTSNRSPTDVLAVAPVAAGMPSMGSVTSGLPGLSSVQRTMDDLMDKFNKGREWSRERYLDPKNIQRQQAYSAASLLLDFSSPGNSARKRSSGMFASAGSASASASASAAAFPEPASSARHRRRPSWGSIQASPAFPSNRPSTASGSFFHAASASGASSAGSAASAGDADPCLATASPSNHPYHSSSGLSLAADPPPARLSTASDVFFHAPRAGDSPADGVTSASAFLSGTNIHHSPSSGSMYPARSFGGSDAVGHADMPKRERRTSSILPSSSSLPAEPCPPEAEACALDAVAQLGEPKRRSFTSGMEEQSDSSTHSPLTLSLSSPDEQPQQQQQPQHLLLRQQLPPKASYGRLNSPHVNSQATSSQASQEQQQQQRNQAGRLRKTARVHRRSASYDVTQKPETSIKGELGKNLANLDKVLSPGSTFDADANVQPEYKGVQRVRAFRLSKSPQRQPNP